MRNKEILPFVMTWMDLKSIMLSKINQTEEIERYWSKATNFQL